MIIILYIVNGDILDTREEDGISFLEDNSYGPILALCTSTPHAEYPVLNCVYNNYFNDKIFEFHTHTIINNH